jgi:hypothetical protein
VQPLQVLVVLWAVVPSEALERRVDRGAHEGVRQARQSTAEKARKGKIGLNL